MMNVLLFSEIYFIFIFLAFSLQCSDSKKNESILKYL